MRLIQFLLLIVVLFISSCSNNHNSSQVTDTEIVSIKINPGALLLTSVGETQGLSATAYNAAGVALAESVFTWTSSKPDTVSVSQGGMVTSMASLGSAQITASLNGVTSAPLLAVIAQPVAEAVLVGDTQVVGDIRVLDETVPFTVGSLYEVNLININAPDIGDILLGSGEAPVGGRVVDVREEDGRIIVTLEFVYFDELFDAFEISEKLPLSKENMVVNEQVAELYDSTINPDGSVTYTPKQDNINAVPVAIVGEPVGNNTIINRGPFQCKTNLQSMPVALNQLPTVRYNSNLYLTIGMPGNQIILMVAGDISVDAHTIWNITQAFEGKINCDAEWGRFRIPLPLGVASLFLGGSVPFGPGFELAGKLDWSGWTVIAKSHAEADMTMALNCNIGSNCDFIRDFNSDSSFSIDWQNNGNTSISDSVRFSPSVSGYLFANLEVGLRHPNTFGLEVLAARAGLNMSGTLATVNGQISDDNFSANYKLSLDASIGAGSHVTQFLNRFRLGMLAAPHLFTLPLSTSPRAASLRADVRSFMFNDPVNFKVKLDPASLEFLLTYNVEAIEVYRSKIDTFGDIVGELIGSASASSGQTEFTIPWIANFSGDIEDNFYAYVVTKFVPLASLESLELGKVLPSGKIVFSSTRDGNNEIYVMNDDGTTPINLSHTPDFHEFKPIWSPDGTRVAYIRRPVGGSPMLDRLYVMDVDGSNTTQLTDFSIATPAWSPDGSSIVATIAIGNSYGFSFINPDGGAVNVNLYDARLARPLSEPRWTPDGSRVYFLSRHFDDDEQVQIYTVNADNYRVSRLTSFDSNIFWEKYLPTWSPDGTKIAFEGMSASGSDDIELYVSNTSGTNLKRLTEQRRSYPVDYIAWSPDSTKIIFGDDEDIGSGNGYGMQIINVLSRNEHQLIGANNGRNLAPAWSKDGDYIYFESYRDGNREIYRMNADGSDPVNLTNNSASDSGFALQP